MAFEVQYFRKGDANPTYRKAAETGQMMFYPDADARQPKLLCITHINSDKGVGVFCEDNPPVEGEDMAIETTQLFSGSNFLGKSRSVVTLSLRIILNQAKSAS